jgi:pterin-4a-carbinolamine dehydratase
VDEKRVTAQAFHAVEGVEDWRILYGGAFAPYRTASYAEAAWLVVAIASQAEELGLFPDIDVRPGGSP